MAYWPGMVDLDLETYSPGTVELVFPPGPGYVSYTFMKLDPARHMLAVASLSVFDKHDDLGAVAAYISEYVQGGTTFPKPGDPLLDLSNLWGTNITEVTFVLTGYDCFAKSANVIHFY